MNDAPHLLAIVESKMAQVRTQLEHGSPAKAKELLEEVRIYSQALRLDLAA
ncbi:hypothetical protein [Lichenicoccus roseus]|uniref:hypothetical protein n=1 Tax=Lichenicoccus roseus TaxID=2683649 RepID=UPI001485C3C8|nr:hypothetical protein [Lichenicoccus roseus]